MSNIEIVNENNQWFCPLSFCKSTEHISIHECNHPDKLKFVEPIHKSIIKDITDKIVSVYNQAYTEERLKEIVSTLLKEIQQGYFIEPIEEEQLHILLFRLKVQTLIYWNISYEEKILLVLNAYRRIIYRFIDPIVVEETPLFDHSPESYETVIEEYLLDLDRVFEPFIIPETEDDDYEENSSFLYQENPDSFDDETEVRVDYRGEPDEVMKQEECPICYDKGCFIKIIECNHNFCDCIITHIIKKTGNRETAECPCCRRKITKLGIYDLCDECE